MKDDIQIRKVEHKQKMLQNEEEHKLHMEQLKLQNELLKKQLLL